MEGLIKSNPCQAPGQIGTNYFHELTKSREKLENVVESFITVGLDFICLAKSSHNYKGWRENIVSRNLTLVLRQHGCVRASFLSLIENFKKEESTCFKFRQFTSAQIE